MTLAQSLAKSERTLLVDADLRMSTLGMRFGLPFRLRGLTDLLLFDGRASDFIKPTDTANLDILPAGRLTENPSELIRSQEFKALLKQLQHSYDRIVIDTPPMKAVKDSLYLGQLAGGVLLVMKASQSGEKALKGALETISNNNIDIDGIVINQLNIATAPAAEILHSLAPLIAV
ncbi:hypothetical protein CS022_18960 [Veronia nyctiphanis]|uniref:non-specific protein-tyrosine kinase n=1 Tax=Veronia nyctiphanis TaxID=1278244 RepID=A0A4Q0YNG3_9GAMM|nr:CpsD/CapB family tyrosine-protein kinase [Veronia nyctiphanis]RXJ71955.1 hypothetical protein CS022_18960 [Veronia nyctiphanis]